MKKLIHALSLLNLLMAVHAVDCVVVTTTTQAQLSNGVQRQERYREQHCFDHNNVWIRRLDVQPVNRPDDAHQHLDVDTAIKWYRREAQQVVVELLAPEQQVRVPLQATEWDLIAFDGQFSALAEQRKNLRLNQKSALLSRTISNVETRRAPWQAVQQWRSKEFSDFGD